MPVVAAGHLQWECGIKATTGLWLTSITTQAADTFIVQRNVIAANIVTRD